MSIYTGVEIQSSCYRSAQLICLVASTGVCFCFLPYFPLNSDFQRAIKVVLFPISRLGIAVAILLGVMYFMWILSKKSEMHREQSIFWPLQCRHCMRVLRFPGHPLNLAHELQASFELSMNTTAYQSTSTTVSHRPSNHQKNKASGQTLRQNYENSDDGCSFLCQDIKCKFPANARSPSHCGCFSRFCSDLRCNESHENSTELTIISSPSWGKNLEDEDVPPPQYEELETSFPGDLIECPNEVSGPKRETLQERTLEQQLSSISVHSLFTLRHKSLLNLLQVFGIMAMIGFTSDFVEMCICLHEGSGSAASLAAQLILDISYISGVLFTIVATSKNYDVVCTDKHIFCRYTAIGLAVFFWAAFRQILFPISDYINDARIQPDIACQVSGSFAHFFFKVREVVNPCYEEFAVTGTTVCLQFLTSQLPRSILPPPDGEVVFELTDAHRTNTLLYMIPTKIISALKATCRLCKGPEWITLSFRCRRTISNKCVARSALVLSVLGATLFLICNHFVLWYYKSNFDLSDETAEYLKRLLEIVFTLPSILFCYCHFASTRSFSKFKMQKDFSHHQKLFQEHDILILLCNCGLFSLYIFRIASACGLLLHGGLDPDYFITCIFSIAGGIVAIIQVALTTLFLLVVQRQSIPQEGRRWTYVCLVYATVMSTAQWLYGVKKGSEWTVIGRYIGHRQGEVLTLLLEPFATLYRLHAAMVAYEAYVSLAKGDNERD